MPLVITILKYTGLFFIITGTLGMIFQKEILVKLHFSTISDTVGILLIIFSFMIEKPEYLNYWILFTVLIAFIGPISGIAIAKCYFERHRRK
ncbi:MAG: monovalent cation/H(+) antiporter subunit G [Thermotogota bacterium]|nr:monovalent cation/H(+) antiporter subunit G [Thermotogota bacterium]